MNEKIKNFFACLGGFFSVAFAVCVGIFIGKRNGGSDKSGMAAVESAHSNVGSELKKTGRDISEARGINEDSRRAIDGCKSIIDSVEKRNAEN